jgi:outer membrane receptor protein involved in Fe transport
VAVGLASEHPVTTSREGTFTLEGLAPGRHLVIVRGPDGRSEGRVSIDVTPGGVARADVTLQLTFSEDVVVTESRAGRLRHETPASVDAVTAAELSLVKPSHPGEILGRVPGVWVSATSGEGHQTAIRQPLTTNPVYLYLEDGVPTRSTGFFNHNALYEINVPMAEGIEVTRGPGSALYGSDAIGGLVNVLTRSALDRSGIGGSLEAGGDGWRRVLVDANWSNGAHGLRATVNGTVSEGWRDATAYDRQTATLRWDWLRGSALTKTLLSLNRIDQQTAGSSALPEIDYLEEPSANLTPISFRDVNAVRLSVDHRRMVGRTALSVLPYYRYDSMGLLPNWTLTFDPTEYATDNHSLGVLAKVQRELAPWRTTLTAGVDADWSPGQRVEDVVRATTTPSALPSGRRVFDSYTLGPRIYDYSVTFASASPYAQAELSPTTRLRFSVGLRADRMRYDYDDRLSTPPTARHRRPPDGSRTFTHASPKLGLTYQLSSTASLFGSYRHAFRAPSEGQLFRQGSAFNTIDLDPVRAENVEIGLRVSPRPGLSFDVSTYRLVKHDDILAYRDPLDGLTTAVNAGKTSHRGIEAGVEWSAGSWGVNAAYAYGRHRYVDWLVDPAAGIDLSGFEQESAPRHLGSASVRVAPSARVTAAADVTVLGSYWMDANNTTRYGGHALVNLRGQVDAGPHARLFVKVLNLFDRLYAESASFTVARGRELAPGRPRTVFAGVELGWRR